MGSTFVSGVLAINKGQEPNWELASERLKSITDNELQSLLDDYSQEFEVFSDELNFDSAREVLRRVLADIRGGWEGDSYFNRFDIQNLTLLVTGERTNGDPVEEVTLMVLFEVSGMMAAAGFVE